MDLALMILAWIAALADWAAVFKGWRKIELAAKPAVMLFLSAWLVASTGLRGNLLWFGTGLLFSLAGDVLLILSERYFLAGLIAFLITQIAYSLGLTYQTSLLGAWDLLIAFILILSAIRILQRMIPVMRSKGLNNLILPVRLYSAVISLMLFCAMRTLSQPEWGSIPSALVSMGALSLYVSDLFLAWDKFVIPVKNGALIIIIAYHLGQFALIAGAAMRFG